MSDLLDDESRTFETGTGMWNVSGGSSVISASSDQAHSGAQSLKLIKPTPNNFWILWSSYIPIVPALVDLRVWIYSPADLKIVTPHPMGIVFGMEWYDGSYAVVDGNYVSGVPFTEIPGTWQEWGVIDPLDLSTAHLASFCRIFLFSQEETASGYTRYFDDFKAEYAGAKAAPPALRQRQNPLRVK